MKPKYVAALLAGLAPVTGLGAQVSQVDYASLTGAEFVDFSGVAGGPSPGTNYDGVTVIDGVAFGERFAGQTLTAVGNFDQLGGAPVGGLTLTAGAANRNFTVFQSPAGKVLSGNGPTGSPDPNAIGEGAVALMFSSGQSEFGFRLAGGHGGNVNLGFFRGDGSLIQSIVLSGIPLITTYGFSRDGGFSDIRGISIWNDDVTGIGLADLRHDVESTIPEPATWAMMIGGFGLAGGAVRRRRREAVAIA